MENLLLCDITYMLIKKEEVLLSILVMAYTLFSQAESRMTLSYAFANLPTTQGSAYYPFDPSRFPAYPLGYVNANTTVQINLKAWNDNIEGRIAVGIINSTFFADLNLVAQLFQQSIDGIPEKTCNILKLCTRSFLINQPNSYYIYLVPTSYSQPFIEPINIVVYTYSGSDSTNKQLVLKVADVVRKSVIGKYLYISASNDYTEQTIYFSVSGISNITLTDPIPIVIAPIQPGSFSLSNYYDIPLNYYSYVGGVVTLTAQIRRGYYILLFNAAITNSSRVTVSWQTDPFACPHDPQYTDIYALTQGCTFAQRPEQGYPCLNFNAVTQECTACINGYTLDPATKICKANTDCPDRKYYHFGTCYDVSPLCGSYDIYTGDCLGCASPATHDISAGVCIPKNITCTPRQWKNGSVCVDVPSGCASFNPQNGVCLSCADTFELSAGICTKINIVCAANEYVKGTTCTPIPAQCLFFDKVHGVCSFCIVGYFINSGVCQRLQCPNGKFPSRLGLFCIDASPLCGSFDPLSGACLSCKDRNHVLKADGSCGQVANPLAGCRARERLGFGSCSNVKGNCKIYVMQTGECDRCEQGFDKDYRGLCVAAVKCGASAWAVNGECLAFPPNCAAVDAVGLCLRCVSADYRLEAGQCVRINRCGDRQFKNAGGECIDVSPLCLEFNPSNGQCLSCRLEGASPFLGVCCELGLRWDGRACSVINSQVAPDACVTVHPSLGVCLQCGPGFAPDPILTSTCVPE